MRAFEFFTGFGEAFQYSNQLVATAGWVAAAAAGAEYGNLGNAYLKIIQERVFDPIDMDNTTFSLEEIECHSALCVAYSCQMGGTSISKI